MIYDLGGITVSDVKRSTRSDVIEQEIDTQRDTFEDLVPKTTTSKQTSITSHPGINRIQQQCLCLNSETNNAVLALMARHLSPPATTCSSQRHGPLQTKFDTNSFTVGIDNHATACISMQQWKGSELKGVGTTPILGIRTVRWNISDNTTGQKHTLDIPGSLYVPTMSKCLLSPQHVASDCDTCDTGTTGCYTIATTTTLTFGPNREHTLTVQHNPSTKVPEINKATPSCKMRQYYGVIDVQLLYQLSPIMSSYTHTYNIYHTNRVSTQYVG